MLTWAEALNISTIVARGNDAIRWKVVTAFQILGTNASGALPRLELLCNNQDLAVSSAAKLAVQRIRTSSFQTGSVVGSKNTLSVAKSPYSLTRLEFWAVSALLSITRIGR